MTQPTRFGRIPRRKLFFDEREILEYSNEPEKAYENYVQVLETRAASENAPEVVHELASEPQVDYTPPINVQNEPFQVLCKERDPLSLLLLFLGGFNCLSLIYEATNAYAERQVSTTNRGPHSRPWHPIQPIELLRWLGILFYMADHIEPNRINHWQVSKYQKRSPIAEIMSRVRWE